MQEEVYPAGIRYGPISTQRASEIPQADDIFGWLIGTWEIDAVLSNSDGCTHPHDHGAIESISDLDFVTNYVAY
jgi:hypothetical protein